MSTGRPHYSKQALAEMAKTNPLGARALILANHEQYVRDGYIGDAAPVAGSAAPPATPVAPPSNPPATPAMSFRERVTALDKTDPLAARALLLSAPGAYLDNTAGPAPAATEAARVELGVEALNAHVKTKSAKAAEQARADLLKELGATSIEDARAKLGIAPPAPATPPAPPAVPK